MFDVQSPRFGYHVAFHAGEINHCPGCGKTQWLVGRLTAECAFCKTAIPISAAGTTGIGLFRGQARQPARVPLAA